MFFYVLCVFCVWPGDLCVWTVLRCLGCLTSWSCCLARGLCLHLLHRGSCVWCFDRPWASWVVWAWGLVCLFRRDVVLCYGKSAITC